MERQQTVKLTKANSTSHNNLQAKLALQKPTPLSHPILQLQRKIGNQAVTRLLSSGGIQGKLSISHPADPGRTRSGPCRRRCHADGGAGSG